LATRQYEGVKNTPHNYIVLMRGISKKKLA
jgi:hypothetical protein